MTVLHVLLGAGGVGKTTLAAGYGVALARAGGRVGLLGIDPSYRLQDALGIRLGDRAVTVPGAPGLSAALLVPGDALRRWSSEDVEDRAAQARLLANPFFLALSDRLASATDVLASVRVAEWAERDPALTDLVVDTAPGLNALEFLRRPEQVEAFLTGRLVTALRWLAHIERQGSFSAVEAGARRMLAGLARIGGTRMLLDLAELLSLVQRPFEHLLARLGRARLWLEGDDARILLVTSARDEAAAATAIQTCAVLQDLGMGPWATIVNRALPAALGRELAAVEQEATTPEAAAEVRYARACATAQERVVAQVARLAPRLVVLGAGRGLDGEGRLEALAAIGEQLRVALA
jgi:anion-transporting  ArsA/GET3 family ATPase